MNAAFPWLTSNTKVDYPFTLRQDDGLHELFVDAYVAHTQERTRDEFLQVTRFNPAGVFTLKFENGTTLAALTSGDGFVSRTFGDYTLYEWKKVESDGNYVLARTTVLTSKLADFSFPVTPSAAFLQPSVVNPEIGKVRRMGTSINGVPCCIGITDKPIIFEAGNNVLLELGEEQETLQLELTETEDEVRTPTTIVINANEGAGTGRYPTCTSLASEIKTIGGVGGDDNGNLLLDLRDCLWTELRLDGPTSSPVNPNTDYLATLEAALLQLHANCKACCDCPDYGAIYSNMKDVFSRAQAVAARIEKVRQDYQDLRQDIIDLANERQVGLAVKLRVQSGPDFSIAFSGTLGNSSCAEEEDIVLKFTIGDEDAVYTPKSGRFEGEGIHDLQLDPLVTSVSGGTEFQISIASLKAKKYARYRFAVRIGPGASSRAGRNVDVKAEAYQESVLKASDSAKVTLSAPLEKS